MIYIILPKSDYLLNLLYFMIKTQK